MQQRRWADHGNDWPEGHRLCMKCLQMLPVEQFHKHRLCKGGYNSVCKECRKPLSIQHHKNRSIERRLYDSAKSRSTKNGREFTLLLEDIVIPDICPVFNVPLVEKTPYAASIDRKDSSRGYTKDNIQIISLRANILKNDSTLQELEQLVSFMRKSQCELVL